MNRRERVDGHPVPRPLLPLALPKQFRLNLLSLGTGKCNLLADEEHVDGAEVEVVKEREGGQSVVGGVLAGVELALELAGVKEFGGSWRFEETHHDGFPLVLDDVT